VAYRVYFRRFGAIVGRDEFDADDDETAWIVAGLLFDAVRDHCDSFELWQGARVVRGAPVAEQIRERAQAIAAKREEAIRNSGWEIAESRRLLDRVRGREPTRT